MVFSGPEFDMWYSTFFAKNTIYQVIPEVKRVHELYTFLLREKPRFTADDYYLTIEQKFETLWAIYRVKHQTGIGMEKFKKYWNETIGGKKDATEANALKVGDVLPPFSFKNEYGKQISSRDLLREGPLVISFFRGTWCPYCVNEMCVLNDSLPQFRALGANLVSLGCDEQALKFFRKLGVIGEVLLDDRNEYAEKCGLMFKLGPVTKQLFLGANLDLMDYSTDKKEWRLPIPATYIVGMDGRIVFAYVKMEYYCRLEPQKIIEVLYDLYEKRERMERRVEMRKEEEVEEVEEEEEEEEVSVLGKRKADDFIDIGLRNTKKQKTFHHTNFYTLREGDMDIYNEK